MLTSIREFASRRVHESRAHHDARERRRRDGCYSRHRRDFRAMARASRSNHRRSPDLRRSRHTLARISDGHRRTRSRRFVANHFRRANLAHRRRRRDGRHDDDRRRDRTRRLIARHIFPNVLPIIIVMAALGTSGTLLLDAALSFLGLGVPPPTPSWGRMIEEATIYFRTAPWLATIPGLAIL